MFLRGKPFAAHRVGRTGAVHRVLVLFIAYREIEPAWKMLIGMQAGR
jgi:hypothetical protein